MKDVNGISVKVGDLLLEETGGGYVDGKDLYSFTLWEMPSGYDGEGFQYSLDGSKHLFAWANVDNSIKLSSKELPKDFMFSFYHGMSDFDSYSKGNSVLGILENSNWKEKSISGEDVSRFKKLLKLRLSSIEDVKKNVELFSTAEHIPNRIVWDVIRLAGRDRAIMVNGELGMAMFEDMLTFQKIIYGLQERNQVAREPNRRNSLPNTTPNKRKEKHGKIQRHL